MVSLLYKKRIININFNIFLASAVATLLAAYPVMVVSRMNHSIAFILLSAFFIDALIDGLLFWGLHWYANYRNSQLQLFFRDYGLLQGHRVFLAFLFFILATSTDYSLMVLFGFERAASFIFSYLTALIITRIVHTIYGLKTGLFEEKQLK